MKKLIVSLLAVAGMVACSNEDVVRQQAGEAIGFSGAFVENATRAEDPSITTGSIDAFRVWAFMDNVTGEVLNDELVTKGEDGLWSYTNVQYWMPGHTYYFAALAPVKGNWTLNTEAANTYGAGIVDFLNVDGSEDLLYAATSVESKLNDNAPVKFLFNHLLSKIKFTFENGFATDNVTVDVKNVTMTAPASGSINLAVENWWDNNEDWVNLPENNDLTLAFGDVETLTAGAFGSAANERLTIPASAEREYVVNFDVVVYSGEVATNFTKTATINVAFEMGKAYNLKATISPETLNLEEIVFDYIEVKDWIEGGEYEFEFTDREESEEPETPVEPEEPSNVITYEIINAATGGYDVQGEKEVIFWYSATNAHVIDFKGFDSCIPGQPVAAGYYSSVEGTIDAGYSIFDYGTTNGVMSSVECTVTDNGNGSLTYDAKFVYDGQEYAFVYTSPAEEVEESGDAVKLVSKSAGEQIGSYAYGCLLKDAEGNNQVKIAVDQYYSWDSALDFPKAKEYTAWVSSPSSIYYGSDFSFVNKTLKVNGVTYANSEVSNAKMTVEATSITIEFTVGGADYKFVYSI